MILRSLTELVGYRCRSKEPIKLAKVHLHMHTAGGDIEAITGWCMLKLALWKECVEIPGRPESSELWMELKS